jgi:hypothetical protein
MYLKIIEQTVVLTGFIVIIVKSICVPQIRGGSHSSSSGLVYFGQYAYQLFSYFPSSNTVLQSWYRLDLYLSNEESTV